MAPSKNKSTYHVPHGQRPGFAPAVLVFLAASFLLAWPWLSGSVTIPWDAKAHFYPQLVFLANAISEGQSPFWTPNVFGGHPQIADPQSLIFSPPYLTLALFGPEPTFAAFDAVAFGMLVAGGLALMGMFRDQAGVRKARSSQRSPSHLADRRRGASSTSARSCRLPGLRSRSFCCCARLIAARSSGARWLD